ncbi:hypothetical protein [Pelosinus fermentans]|nr:hypothetical protein [Pelosinus fermentans]
MFATKGRHSDHFVDVKKMIELSKSIQREIDDIHHEEKFEKSVEI